VGLAIDRLVRNLFFARQWHGGMWCAVLVSGAAVCGGWFGVGG